MPAQRRIERRPYRRTARADRAGADSLPSGSRQLAHGRKYRGRHRPLRGLDRGRQFRGRLLFADRLLSGRRGPGHTERERPRGSRLHLLHVGNFGQAQERRLQSHVLLAERIVVDRHGRADRGRPHSGIPVLRLELRPDTQLHAVAGTRPHPAHRQAVLALAVLRLDSRSRDHLFRRRSHGRQHVAERAAARGGTRRALAQADDLFDRPALSRPVEELRADVRHNPAAALRDVGSRVDLRQPPLPETDGDGRSASQASGAGDRRRRRQPLSGRDRGGNHRRRPAGLFRHDFARGTIRAARRRAHVNRRHRRHGRGRFRYRCRPPQGSHHSRRREHRARRDRQRAAQASEGARGGRGRRAARHLRRGGRRLHCGQARRDISASDARAWCRQNLPEAKCPKELYFLDELPRSDRGKVLRDRLRERWQEETGTPGAA